MRKKRYHFKALKERDLRLIRRIHISLLAKPKDRYLKPWPDPKIERTLPAPVSQAAMKAKPSDRTIKLFRSKKMYVEGQKYESPGKPDHYVETSALNAVASARTLRLAQPKRIIKPARKISKRELAKRKKKYMKHLKERDTWLQSRAAPKKRPLTPPLVELQPSFAWRKWKPLTTLERFEKMIFLAQPPARRKREKPAKVTKVIKPQVTYKETTDRVRELALPRRIPSETLKNMKYKPGKIPRNVLKAVTSERTKALAVPRPRSKAVDNDLREDAFTIPPAALTYKASRRIIELAKPRVKK